MPSRLVRLLLPLRCRGHGSDQGSGQRMDMLSGIRVAMLLLTMATMVFVLTHILLYSDSLSPVAVERGGGGEADYGFVDRTQHTGSTVRLFQRVCRADRRSLVRLIKVDTNESPSISSIIRDNPHLQPGGKYVPTGCRSQQKVAIIIPYRDRWQHLRLLLKHLHPMLQHQMVDYRIFVVEQAGQNIFNKGLIMNIAFDVATKLEDFDCFVYHDVDLIPESELNLYMCNSQARHLSPGVDQMRYVLMYNRLAGGVLALRRSQNIQVNGFSNIYWGWGAEDDDMSRRILDSGLLITRPPNHIGRYKMISHQKREAATNRMDLLSKWRRWRKDGINTLKNLNYSVVAVAEQPLYTNITVDIGPPPLSHPELASVASAKWYWV